MSLETIKSIINQISDYGVPIIYLTGGEALIREDLTEIVRYAKEHNLSVNLKTNGSLLNDEIIQTLHRDSIDDIQISIYGMNNEEYSFVTSCSLESKMFDVVKTNVEKLVENGIQIGLCYIALKHNYRSCVQFIKWCREMGLSENQYFHSTDIQPASSCSLEPLEFALTAEMTAIVRGAINKPAILFLDEPTGSLDMESGKRVLDLLVKFNQAGQTIVMVTHDVSAAVRADKVLLIQDGSIYQTVELGKYKTEQEVERKTRIYSTIYEGVGRV